ncbi:MAG: hypothetical protein ACE5IR_02550 [bacterium]
MSRLILVLVLMLSFFACQQKEEAEQSATTTLSDAQVVAAIEAHINGNLDADGNYAIEDAIESRTRKLKLDYVHTSVHPTDEGRYYACADMREVESKLDLDFYVAAEDGEAKVTEVVIHKVDGVSRN